MKHLKISFCVHVHEWGDDSGSRLTPAFMQKQVAHVAQNVLGAFDETIHDVSMIDEATGESVMDPNIPIF